MKKLATLFAMMGLGVGTALAQGQIDFRNPSTFPVTVKDANGTVYTIGASTAGNPLGPASVRVGLFVGTNNAPFSAMTMVGMTTNSASSNPLAVGTFFGGNPYTLTGYAVSSQISFAYAAWSISTGALTYQQALDPNVTTTGYVSQTPVIGNGYTLGGGASSPALTWGTPDATHPWYVNGLQLTQVVPEPSTIVLGLLGAGALLLRRRK